MWSAGRAQPVARAPSCVLEKCSSSFCFAEQPACAGRWQSSRSLEPLPARLLRRPRGDEAPQRQLSERAGDRLRRLLRRPRGDEAPQRQLSERAGDRLRPWRTAAVELSRARWLLTPHNQVLPITLVMRSCA
jgi:hypothetical protein